MSHLMILVQVPAAHYWVLKISIYLYQIDKVCRASLLKLNKKYNL